ncbi:MAG: pilus assembly protein [Sulfuricella sp.]|nr:pilus assembly protein [Sulfuricella sp.]
MRFLPGRRRERGAVVVEFALIAIVFFSLLLGIMEFGRLLFTWNSAAEATRWGARLAVVCDLGDATIKDKMRLIMPQLQDSNIVIAYTPDPCDETNCQSVAVSVTGVSITTMIPILNVTLPIPPFSTSLPRESMSSTDNPVCT